MQFIYKIYYYKPKILKKSLINHRQFYILVFIIANKKWKTKERYY